MQLSIAHGKLLQSSSQAGTLLLGCMLEPQIVFLWFLMGQFSNCYMIAKNSKGENLPPQSIGVQMVSSPAAMTW